MPVLRLGLRSARYSDKYRYYGYVLDQHSTAANVGTAVLIDLRLCSEFCDVVKFHKTFLNLNQRLEKIRKNQLRYGLICSIYDSRKSTKIRRICGLKS
jgi:hypothetical protein